MNITITPTAEKFMRRMVRFNGGTPQSGFRLKVSAGGCSGLASEFAVEPAPLPGDASLDCNGLSIFLPAESRLLLEGVTIDFGESIAESGLIFRNPNVPAGSCGSHGASAPPAMAKIDVASIRRKN
jgi:iron-sulfur cluster assembly accessory protein